MAVQLTEAAVKEVKRIMEAEGLKDSVLRVGVKGGGCSGLSYSLNFDEESNIGPHDKVTEIDGLKVVVDKKSMLFLGDTTLDFVSGLQGTGFTFKNPLARATCGCGQSFSA